MIKTIQRYINKRDHIFPCTRCHQLSSPLLRIFMCVCSFVSEKKLTFCNEIATHVSNEKIPADLVVNWDQMPLHYIPASKWTMEEPAKFQSQVDRTNEL